MISSYFSDAQEARVVGQSARFIFSNPTLVPFGDAGYDAHGVAQFLEHMFVKLQSNGDGGSDDREVGLGMLSKALENETRLAAEILRDGRLKVFLERLPTMFESANAEGEASYLVRVWELLLYRDSAIAANLSKVLPRTISKMSAHLKSGGSAANSNDNGDDNNDDDDDKELKDSLAVAMLSVVARSQYQNLLMPVAETLLAACLRVGDWRERPDLAELFALVMAVEAPSTWESVFALLTDKAGAVCQDYLGLEVAPRVVSKGSKSGGTSDGSGSNQKQQVRGSGIGAVRATDTAIGASLTLLTQSKESGDMAHFAGMVFSNSDDQEQEQSKSIKKKNKKGKKGSNNTPNTSVNGCALALASLTVYTRILTTLECMLRVGCCTGAVELDLAGLFPVNRAVLGINLNTHAQAHGTEQKMLLPGPTGIAPADLLLVAPSLKVGALSLLRTLLHNTPSAALLKAAAELCDPVSYLFHTPEVKMHPLLAQATTQTVAAVAACFPSILARRLGGTVEGLAALFIAEVESLTREPSIAGVTATLNAKGGASKKKGGGGNSNSNNNASVSDASLPFAQSVHVLSSSSADKAQELAHALRPSVYLPDSSTGLSTNSASAAGADAVFAAVESLLVHCAVLLPEKVQDQLEYTVGQALHSLTKGLLPPTVHHKSAKRAAVAPLRRSPVLQAAILRVARAEVAYPRATGVRSGNSALLLAVCNSCKHQPATAVEAQHSLVLLEALFNPASAPLVTPDYDELAARRARREVEVEAEESQRLMEQARQREKRRFDEAEAEVGTAGSDAEATKRAKTTSAASASASTVKMPAAAAGQDDAMEEEDDEEEEDEEDDEEAAAAAGTAANDDDDDFELPEIV